MKNSFTVVVALACAASVSAAQAQQSSEQSSIETVLVLGKKQAYRGQFDTLETPQVDLELNQQLLQQAGALDLNQALDLSASVARQNNFGGLWNAFAVRGFVGDENLPSNYLVNGFNAGRGFGGSRDLSGVESVEVLKGPRAALYGRGEPGGTVNLVTKRPTFDKSGSVEVAASRFNAIRTDVDYTTPLSSDLAIRLVGFYEDADSFRDTIETRRIGASPSIAWRVNDRSELIYEMEFSDQEVPFDRGVLAVNDQLGAISRTTFLGEPGDGPMKAEVLGHQLEYSYSFSDEWSVRLGYNSRDTELEGFSTEPELSGSRQLLYRDSETLTRQRRYRHYDASYTVFRGELEGQFQLGDAEHRIIIGLDSDDFENDQVFRRVRSPSLASDPSLEQLQAINIFNPVYGQYVLPEPGPQADRVETQESTGIFFQDQISLSEALQIRVGGRFDDYDQRLVNRRSNSTATSSESRFSPQFGLVYRSSETTSLYLSYGENFRPLSGTDSQGNGFDPNQSVSLEAGVKFAMLDGGLDATISVFRVEQENILVVDDPSAFTYAAAGEAESRGIELDISGTLPGDIELWTSVAYVDAEITNDFFDPNFGRQIEAGASLLNIPELTATVQLAKDLQFNGSPMQIGAGLLHVGDRLGYFGTDFELPSYTTARMFVAYDITPNLEIRADIDNLFDEEFYVNSFSELWVQPGAPRTWRISARVSF